LLTIRLTGAGSTAGTLAVPVAGDGGSLAPLPVALDDQTRAEAEALLDGADDAGRAGAVRCLPRPLRRPGQLLLVGVGSGDEESWRAAGAAVARAAAGGAARGTAGQAVTVAVPPGAPECVVRGLAEGLWLAAYRFTGERRGRPAREAGPRRISLAVADGVDYRGALDAARATAEATVLARDLTNMPSSVKNPAWFAARIDREVAGTPGLTVAVRDQDWLAAEGFGGVLAVGGGSASPPRLVEVAWRPRGARAHVVLVGKGITFDSGGLSIKPVAAMKLMRKDMAGAAAVTAAALGAARLKLGVRVTALAPLAENMVSGAAYRPGDVIRHFGGITSESTNSDAEGRLVLADALSYAVRRLRPDLLVDLATLTGANAVALGKRTAALYSDSDALAAALTEAGAEAGERMWRMPLPADYLEYLGSDIADLHSSPVRGAGSVVAALYLREFVGDRRDCWAHVDMSAPSWVDSADGELAAGATGWGVRTLLRWLATLG
jgi:leucyl aminopeptidase